MEYDNNKEKPGQAETRAATETWQKNLFFTCTG
jgi:hypothetical protein